ncbi:uncharacterized protein METZ01_LOCUS332324, partial [marine metagenome]
MTNHHMFIFELHSENALGRFEPVPCRPNTICKLIYNITKTA